MHSQLYPIFISYRHSDTADKAEHLLSLLEASGYRGRVSFDRENLSGRFDLEILRRLDACKDFIAILGPDTLGAVKEDESPWYAQLATCTVEDFPRIEAELVNYKCQRCDSAGIEIQEKDKHIDFVRMEIARAIAHGKNIIPVVPVNSDDFNFDEMKLPDDIKLLNKYQAEKYQDSKDFLFKDILPRIIKRLRTRRLSWLRSFCVVATVLLVFSGLGVWYAFQSEQETFLSLRSQKEYEDFMSRSWFFSDQCSDSLTEFQRLKALGCVPINDAEHTNTKDSIRVRWHDECSLRQLRVVRQLINNMMLVPRGTFTMGTASGGGLAEPPHRETINDDFYLAKFELTEREWYAVVKDSLVGDEKMPMTNISWDDCMNYINTLNRLTGLTFTMPTEAQWEYAAGYPHRECFRYAGSNHANDVAVYADNAPSDGKPQIRGSKSPCSELNIYDLSGNVAEWCMCDDVSKRKKRIRGGSFRSAADEVAITYSDAATGSEGSPTIGMRLMLIK